MKQISIKYLLLLCLMLIFPLKSFAGGWYFFEPGVGYYQGHYQTNKVSGIGFDFKLGFNIDKIYIGADVGYATDLNVSGVAYDIDMNNMGVVLGYNAGALRIWYTFITGATNSYKSGATEYEVTGTGSKLGIGGKISGTTYINLESNFLKYDELTTDGTLSTVDYFMDITLLSVSWVF